MSSARALTGISLDELREAFLGGEEVLRQMLALFGPQARERMAQLEALLAVWDTAGMRDALHSLVNICGAVRAHGMAERGKALGDAVKRGDRSLAEQCLLALQREAALVLGHADLLLEALQHDKPSVWSVSLP